MNISLSTPIQKAFEQIKKILFTPFAPEIWIYLGFSAWLSSLTETGFKFYLPGNFYEGPIFHGTEKHKLDFESLVRQIEKIDLDFVLPLAGIILVTLLGVYLLLSWIAARGKFMFLENTVLIQKAVKAPWIANRSLANSLFIWKLILGLLSFIIYIPVFLLTALSLFDFFKNLLPGLSPDWVAWVPVINSAGLAILIPANIILLIIFALIFMTLEDFIIPLMWKHRQNTLAAVQLFIPELKRNAGNFIVYFLFRWILMLASGVIVFLVVIFTCCIAGCLLAIPLVGTILLLPVHLLFRLFSVYYLGQSGDDYNLFGNVP